MPAYSQAQRIIAIGTPLTGKESMLLKSFELTERLGQLYSVDAVMLCESETVDYSKIVGQNVTIRLAVRNGGTRYLNGMVSRFLQTGTEGTLARYRATIVPNVWLLTRRSDCRIFQNMSTQDILKKVLEGLDVKWDLQGTYPKREYCVQYRETDFNFVSRLMEEEGIYYFFQHGDGKHTMVVCDSSGSHEAAAEYDQVAYHQRTKQLQGGDYVTDWAVEKTIQPGKFEQTDYDFKAPKKSLLTKAATKLVDGDDKLEIYDYPGEYVEVSPGTARAKVRLQELQTAFETAYGHGDARGLSAGYTFNLTDHAREDQNREYLVTSVTLRASVDDYESTSPGTGGNGEPTYSCTFTAIDAKRQFRPARLTPKPAVQGPQTAVVVGPAGEEIYTDEYGRVKLQFHWDRQSKADENSSCFVRVSQAWAGNKFGAMFLPRIGQEVIVDFLEGDPDQPVVTGRVYNAVNMPPYKLPDNKTMSTTKTKSSKGGGPEDFNEIRFEDKKGEEQIFVQAQKNLDVRVENDRYVSIGHDDNLTVDHDKLEQVKNNRNETVDADHVESIGKDRHLTVQGKEAKQVGKSHSFVVKGDVIEEFKAKQSTVVTGDHYLKAQNIVIEALTNVTIKVGQSYIAIEAGGIKIGTTGQIVLEAQGTLEAKGTGGVTIQTPATLESKGSMVTVQGDATVEVKGPMTTVKGDGMLTLKGGMVMIN